MRIGEFEFTDNGSNVHVKYVGKPIYLTTASPDNNWMEKYIKRELLDHIEPIKITLPMREYIKQDIKLNKEICRSWEDWAYNTLPPVDSTIKDQVNIKTKKEKETEMSKDINDYIGCYVKDISFNPPYTTILWEDGTNTTVCCKDEPYDSEKGFAMAVLKKLFGDDYYKDMKKDLADHGAYEKDAAKVFLRDTSVVGALVHGYIDETNTCKIKKLEEENEKLKKKIEKLKKTTNRLYGCDNKMLDDTNRLLKSALESLKKCNASLKKENEDLKKAKENMAKKLAETKSLRQENEKLKLHLDALNEQLSDFRNANYIQSKAIDDLRMDRIGLQKKIESLEKENAKYKDIVDMQKQYDELKEQYDLLTECHKRQAFTIGKQREEVEKLNQIKEILK